MKQAKEVETVGTMIGMYCHGFHRHKKGELCPECQELYEFVKQKRSRCPYGDEKNFCSVCKIHCYQSNPAMREKIRVVMRYAGPRMMFSHPVMAFSHVHATLSAKREAKRMAKKEAKK